MDFLQNSLFQAETFVKIIKGTNRLRCETNFCVYFYTFETKVLKILCVPLDYRLFPIEYSLVKIGFGFISHGGPREGWGLKGLGGKSLFGRGFPSVWGSSFSRNFGFGCWLGPIVVGCP